jgi:hypothetical protein
MATLLDLGILSHFGSIFVVLLLFAIVFGLLEATKPFGDGKKGLHSIIALFIGLLFLISNSASSMVKVMVPWFIIVMVFIFFVMLMFRMFGVGDDVFKNVVKNGAVYPWIIIFSLLVLFGALASVFGQTLLEAGGSPSNGVVHAGIAGSNSTVVSSATSTGSFADNMLNTLRNPKVLGMVFIFLTGAFIMIFLTRPINPD